MSSISSFLERRKTQASTPTSSFFKNGSSNGSKASLTSIESTHSLYRERNPWTDSGVNLPDDEHYPKINFGVGIKAGQQILLSDAAAPKYDTLGPLPNIGTHSRPGTGVGPGFQSYMQRQAQ